MNTILQNHTDEMDICEPWIEEPRLSNAELAKEVYRLIIESGNIIDPDIIRDIIDGEIKSLEQSNP